MGLLELSRKRTIKSFFENYTTTCPICGGTGIIKSQKLLLKELYEKIENAPKEAKEAIIKLHPYYKNEVNKKQLEKIKNLVYHLHFTHTDPKSFEITWKL